MSHRVTPPNPTVEFSVPNMLWTWRCPICDGRGDYVHRFYRDAKFHGKRHIRIVHR